MYSVDACTRSALPLYYEYNKLELQLLPVEQAPVKAGKIWGDRETQAIHIFNIVPKAYLPTLVNYI